MKAITIRELHAKTGHWVRAARRHESIVVTDRGRAVATLGPIDEKPAGNPFARRVLLPAYKALRPKLGRGTDSTEIVSSDRDRG